MGVLRHGSRDHQRVAVTLDGGPTTTTPALLAALDQLGIPATFFVTGVQVEARPAMVREYLRRGHQVASAGYDATPFPSLSRSALLDACARTENALGGGQLTGRPWVRPPNGELDARSLVALRSAGYVVALWSVDASAATDASSIGPGDVVRLREDSPHTLEALAAIARASRDAGYEHVTLYDMFAS